MSGIIQSSQERRSEDIVYIITGGGSGIGKALALALAQRGKAVLIVGRRESLLQETALKSDLIKYLCADVSKPDDLKLIQDYLHATRAITGLINNAGTIHPVASIMTINSIEWHNTLGTNLDAALFLPQLLHDKLAGGRVLNVGSGAAYFAIKGWTAYCVSKAALSMLTRCWQQEVDTLSFASVMPGIIDTQMQEIARSGDNMDAEHTNFYRRLKRNNRLVAPETVAEFLVWLLLDTDKTRYGSQEWDIYDTAHHQEWLKAPHQVLHWDF